MDFSILEAPKWGDHDDRWYKQFATAGFFFEKYTLLCPLIISTFSWGQKDYYDKSAYFE